MLVQHWKRLDEHQVCPHCRLVALAQEINKKTARRRALSAVT
jgi:hypothetical protein